MKNMIFAPVAVCLVAWSYAPALAIADASPPKGQLQLSLLHNTVTLGEPIVLKYRITDFGNGQLDAYMGKGKRGWLSMSLADASGATVQSIPDPIQAKGGIYEDGISVKSGSFSEGYVVVSQKFQPTHPGRYRLRLSSHLNYSWDDTPGENVTNDEKFILPFTVATRDQQKLLAVAESLRQTVLHNNTDGDKLATEELFSMHDPVCLPVWRELALDPALDPWRALYAARQLADVGSISANDILAEMQTVAPERWSLTGASPQDELERMQRNSSTGAKRHISGLLEDAGASPGHPPIGSAN